MKDPNICHKCGSNRNTKLLKTGSKKHGSSMETEWEIYECRDCKNCVIFYKAISSGLDLKKGDTLNLKISVEISE